MENEDLGIASTSIGSRLQILFESGIEQLAINPLTGDLAAEEIVGNPGGYIHSILSVQSHLGIIGSVLLFCFLAERLIELYRSGDNAILKVVTPPIVLMAVIGTFFTWMPLWFLIGALYTVRR